MHISKEFLMEAVGLSLLVALILISMQLFQRATKITTLLQERQEEQIVELEEYEIVKYDGLQIDGMTAISYMKRMVDTYELPVYVATLNSEFILTNTAEFEELRNVHSEKYISPLTKYACNVIRDENKVITKIQLEIMKERK